MSKTNKKFNLKNLTRTETLEEKLTKSFVHDNYMERNGAENLATNILIQKLLLRDGYAILKIEDNPSQFEKEISITKMGMLKDFRRKNNVKVVPIFSTFKTITEDGGETFM